MFFEKPVLVVNFVVELARTIIGVDELWRKNETDLKKISKPLIESARKLVNEPKKQPAVEVVE